MITSNLGMNIERDYDGRIDEDKETHVAMLQIIMLNLMILLQ
ncbi:hypothetical protein [Bacillus anthracis]